MNTPLASTPDHPPAPAQSHHWESGRLIVHSSGPDAGAMRLDIDLKDFDSPEEVIRHIELLLPGEHTALSPFEVEGADGRFQIGFFSADISNAGHLPSEATLSWTGVGSPVRMRNIPVVSATKVESVLKHDDLMTTQPVSRLSYPRTVLVAIGGALLAMSISMLALLQLD